MTEHPYPQPGEPTGLLLRGADHASIKAALDAGATLFAVGRRQPAEPWPMPDDEENPDG